MHQQHKLRVFHFTVTRNVGADITRNVAVSVTMLGCCGQCHDDRTMQSMSLFLDAVVKACCYGSLRLDIAVGAVGWPVEPGHGQQLQTVERVLAGPRVLLSVLPSHALAATTNHSMLHVM